MVCQFYFRIGGKFESLLLLVSPYRMDKKTRMAPMSSPADSPFSNVAAHSKMVTDQSASRLSGKAASDALKKGNNAGMLFKKEVKAATNVRDHVQALQRLRVAEKGPKGDALRQWAPS